MSQPSVLLFDIDDTLITTGGAGRRAVVRAFESICGAGPWLGFPLGGRTDRAIVREGLRERGLADDDRRIEEVLEAYLRFLVDEVAASPDYAVHPGVGAVLDGCRVGRCAIGLGTGNLRRGAAIKLSRVGLWERFSFGGFGCDHEDRAEILRVGAARGAESLGLPVEACRITVIGDTPRDIVAAQAIGARSIAVATGRFDVTALDAAGADAVFRDLAQDGALEAVLG